MEELDGRLESIEGAPIKSRFPLTTPMKAAIVLSTLSALLLIGSLDVQRYGPLLFYLYGSLPFAHVFTYLKTGKRIYEENSRNVGVANSYNTAGMLVGTLTVIGEISKGLLPLLVSFLWFSFSLDVSAFFLIGSLLGTNFSIFLRLRGGMGTTMMLWSYLFLSPLVLIATLVLMVTGLKLMKNSYHVAIMVYGAAPVWAWLLDGRLTLVLLTIYVSALYIIKFRPEMNDFMYGMGTKRSRGKVRTDQASQGPDTRAP